MASYKPTESQKENFMKQCLKRVYGNRCMICGMTWEMFKEKYPNAKDFLLEHRNGNNRDYDFDNCQLACYSCNQLKRPDFQEGAAETVKSVCVNSGGTNDESDTQKSRRLAKMRSAPIEIEINRSAEPLVRRYIWENVSRAGGLFRDDAKNEAAEYAGCNPVTADRIIGKMVSRAGPMKSEKTKSNDEVIVLRNNYNPNPETWTGKLDIQLMKDRLQTIEEEKLRVQTETAMTVAMAKIETKSTLKQADRLAKQRDLLIRMLATATGKEHGDILKELKAAGLVQDEFDDSNDLPGVPTAKVPPGVQ